EARQYGLQRAGSEASRGASPRISRRAGSDCSASADPGWRARFSLFDGLARPSSGEKACDLLPHSVTMRAQEADLSDSQDAQRKILTLERKLAELEAQLDERRVSRYSTDARLNRLLGDPLVLATFPHLILVLSRELRILYVNRAEA